jgi:TetR/AcrR family transcriptional regulator, transcriptional repressor of bet genes
VVKPKLIIRPFVNQRRRRGLRRRPTKSEMLAIGNRRMQLLNAAMRAIQDHGLQNLTLKKVTDIASVTPAVVSFHFANKQGLLAETLRHLAVEFDSQLQMRIEGVEDPREKLRCIVRMMLDEEIASERHVAVWYTFMGERGWQQFYNGVIAKYDRRFWDFILNCFTERARQLGCRPSNHVVEAATRGFIGMLDGFWQEILFDDSSLDRAAAAQLCGTYLDLLDSAFRNAKDRK